MKQFLLTILILFHFNLIFGQTSLKEIALIHGDYIVGFNHYMSYDSTRTYKRIYDWNNESIPRPIPVSVWFPADQKSGSIDVLTVLDYMEILKEEEEWEYLPNEQILNWFNYANTITNQEHLKERTSAYPNINAVKGLFPVLIYAPSYQASSIENFALCEYLASHGYIVISSPSRGTETRYFDGGSEKDLETQARDIEFLIKEIAKTPHTDLNRIATMGFSFGGLSNVLTQMRNKNIKAILSLDGSVKYQYEKLTKSPFFDIQKVDIPFIHMAQKNIPTEVLKEDKIDPSLNHKFEFYDSLVHSYAYRLQFNNLSHSYFSTLGVLFQQRDERQDKSDQEIMESYKLVAEYALNFLNAYLKNNAEALNFINNPPINNGIKDNLISYHKKKPLIETFNFNDFNELASKENYQNLEQLYSKILKHNPTLELPEGKLNNLGLQLLFKPNTSEQGIKIFLLATGLYPKSANLFDSLAEGYLYLGKHKKAIEAFEKSLDLNSQNQNAVKRLKQLQD